MIRIGPQRPVNADAIVAPQGYRVEALITGLTFPTAISFGPGGEIYLAEGGGVAGNLVAMPRVLRVDPDGSVNEIGRLENPIAGLVYRQGELLIAEDGSMPRILRVTAEGEVRILVEGLPGGGDYGFSGLSLDAQGALLFGLGTRTNSGVVGLDNAGRGWVALFPDWADVPGADVELAGVNYVTTSPAPWGAGLARVTTGSLKPFGRRCEPGEVVRGAARCGGAVYRLAPDAAEPERLAWGLRNPVGVARAPDGRLFATEGGMEERGSRPIAAAPDNLWEIRPGAYYGWPDYAGGISVTDPRFRLPGHPQPRLLLRNAPRVTESPVATFPTRSGVGRLDFSAASAFGFVGEAFVALSGAWSVPAFLLEESAPTGCRVVRVDPRSGTVAEFLVNRHAVPSSADGSGGLERPFDIRFDPTGEVLYVLDLGEVRVDREYGLVPFGGTGVLWRVTRVRPMAPGKPEAGRAPRAKAPEAEAPGETEAAPEGPGELAVEAPSAGAEEPAEEFGPEPGAPPEAAGEQPDELAPGAGVAETESE